MQSTLFSLLLFLMQTECLWISWEQKQKIFNGKVSPLLQPSGTGCQTSFTKQKDIASFQQQQKSYLFSTLRSPHPSPLPHVFLLLLSYPFFSGTWPPQRVLCWAKTPNPSSQAFSVITNRHCIDGWSVRWLESDFNIQMNVILASCDCSCYVLSWLTAIVPLEGFAWNLLQSFILLQCWGQWGKHGSHALCLSTRTFIVIFWLVEAAGVIGSPEPSITLHVQCQDPPPALAK